MTDPVLQIPQGADDTMLQVKTGPTPTRHFAVTREPVNSVALTPGTSETSGIGQGITKSTVEEFFECQVEELGDKEVRLRTRSLTGEEGVAYLPIEKIPAGERRHLALGAPVRVAIVLNQDGSTVRREHEVRVLRPSQWRAPVSPEGRDRITDFILERMNAILSR